MRNRLRRRTPADLLADLRRSHRLLEVTDEAVLTIDDEGSIRSANRAASELLGMSVDELVGVAAAATLAGRFPLLGDVPVGLSNAEASVHVGDGEPRSVLVSTRRTGDGARPLLAVFARDISERKLLEDRLTHDATHDHLTGLANRPRLIAELERAAARADRSGHGVGLLFIDLDRFKGVNDTLGHQVGDQVLRAVADRLRAATRDRDLVARNGGDEFVVLAEEAEELATVVRLAERIQAALSQPFRVGDDTIPVSASIGVTLLDAEELRSLDHLRDADVAMYHAKSTGPGQIRVFDDHLRHWVEQRFDLERELRRAVGVGALDAVIQPVIDLRRGSVVGGELLCRWTTDDGREIPPHAFIEVAEDSMLVVEIGRWMLDRAGAVLSEWAHDGLDLTLAVNLSGRHLAHPGVVDDVASACARWAIEPHRLVIEVAETPLLRDLAEAAVTLHEIRRVGVAICVDDFGVGDASLRSLRELPVAQVKVDRSIVAGFGRIGADTMIVTRLTRLADVLGVAIVAEGVETEEQREELADLGCDFAQGFLFARPMLPASFRPWHARWRHQHTHPSLWPRAG